MPELPEVETVRQTLLEVLLGQIIEQVEVRLPRLIKYPDPTSFCNLIVGRSVLNIDRRGKYLLVRLSDEYTMVIHLRMTGQLRFSSPAEPEPKHTHVIFKLSGVKELRFTDIRTFGAFYLAPDQVIEEISGISRLGFEPLEEFPLEEFRKLLSRRTTKIKNLLLDQRLIAGIGNIYADEALFLAKVHPLTSANQLTSNQVEALHTAIKQVLAAGVAMRGTSFSDYVDGLGRSGSFQHQLTVYGREGEACRSCGEAIVRMRIAGRSAHYCPNCQPTTEQ